MRGMGAARALALPLLRGVLVVLVVAVVSLVLLHLAPGDPLASSADDPLVPTEARARVRAQMGLDRPLPAKVGAWFAYAARGDLGFSLSAGMPVAEAVAGALPYTLRLGGVALVLGFALGIAVALVQARAPESRWDRWVGGGALALWALPEFIIALGLIQLFSLRLGWLPSSGASDPWSTGGGAIRWTEQLRHLVLPALTLALIVAAQVSRHQRVALLEAWREPFIRAARARGVREGALLYRHAWRAALAPTIALAGLALPALAGGALIVEQVFAWPGMGTLAFKALAERDAQLALGCVVPMAAVVVGGGVLADAAHRWLDPRRATEPS